MEGYRLRLADWIIFSELRDKVVDPYRESRGLNLTELLFSHRKNEFLIHDASGPKSKEIIRITPTSAYCVEVFEENYQDLGEQLEGKLNEIKEGIASFYKEIIETKRMD